MLTYRGFIVNFKVGPFKPIKVTNLTLKQACDKDVTK